MSNELKPYSDYKDSGVPWLGEVPEHWVVARIKNVLQETDRRSKDGKGIHLSLTRAYGLIPHAEASDRIASVENLSGYKICAPGELVMNRMQAWSGMFAVPKQKGLVSPDYSVYRTIIEADVTYFERLFKTSTFVDQFAQRSKGIGTGFNRLYTPEFGAIPVIIPPYEEQQAIARYLDRFERLTRRYIRAKQRLIELLEEQKQTLIQRAVTRGLDPDVPLTDSGVEWLGKIPEHWELRVLSRLITNIEQGWSPVAAEGKIVDNQWVVLTLSAVKKGCFHPEAIKPVSRSAEIPVNIEVDTGDFLLTRSNTRKLVGDVCVVDNVRPRTLLCDLIYRLTINESRLHPRFLMYWLLSPLGRFQIEADARGSSQTMVKLSQGHIKNWKVPLPPLHEQVLIANYLDKKIQKWRLTTSNLEHQIDLVREYRTRLIADVVTGKLDVRGVKLPDLDAAVSGAAASGTNQEASLN